MKQMNTFERNYRSNSLHHMAIVACLFLAAGLLAIRNFAAGINASAELQRHHQTDEMLGTLAVIDDLARASVKASIKVLTSDAGSMGKPSLGHPVSLGKENLPDLLLGGKSQLNNFALIYRLREKTGATATLFYAAATTSCASPRM